MLNQLNLEKRVETRQILEVITYKMVVPLYFAFWILDIVYVPYYKWQFLAIRSLVIPAALMVHWMLKHATTYEQVQRVGLFLMFMCASILNTMIYFIGNGELYVIPLQLVAIGGLSFVPWSHRYFIAAILSVYLPYYAITLSRLNGQSDYDRLLVISFFVVGVVSITWIIHNYRDKLRERERNMRSDLEKEVAQRKQTEKELIIARDQALAATRAKEAFLANMSHEIRTPLTAIIGYAEYSLDTRISESEQQTALKTIASSSTHLLHIINDILDFSKIEADSIELDVNTLDPFHLAGEVQSLLMPLANKKEIPINLQYHFPLPTTITSDSLRIKQILINLCSNAIKFTERGSVTLSLAFDQAKNKLIYRVKDSGVGMTDQQLEHIFEPFKQADSSIAQRYGGTGLGLSLSKRLAELLGGTLTVSSKAGTGSEFTLAIDAGQDDSRIFVDKLEQLTEFAISTPVSVQFKKLSGDVLLAEDNENNRNLISLYLTTMGLKVTTAENGKIALQLAKSHGYDLILMDMQMPVLSGVEAVRQLRECGYGLPVVALTANTTGEDRRACIEAGCNDFMTKPVTRDLLYQKVAHYMGEQQYCDDNLLPLYSSLLEEEPDIDDIVVQFIDKLPGILDSIREHYENNDSNKLKDVIHNLKGMGGGFGFPQLSELSKRIEQLIFQSKPEAIGPLIGELNIIVSRIMAGKPQNPNKVFGTRNY